MSDIKQLTDEVRAELSGKTTEARRSSVRELFESGFNVRPYLLALLEGNAGVNGTPESRGFKFVQSYSLKLWEYELGNGRSIFYRQMGSYYEGWPTP